ncbi:hypothetical protein S40288_10605 [Stachybotrys chartarum IBT 40288]|nr:hypothetical protein S40288_10605 [Stachybotrys chartarum IBT 40288]
MVQTVETDRRHSSPTCLKEALAGEDTLLRTVASTMFGQYHVVGANIRSADRHTSAGQEDVWPGSARPNAHAALGSPPADARRRFGSAAYQARIPMSGMVMPPARWRSRDLLHGSSQVPACAHGGALVFSREPSSRPVNSTTKAAGGRTGTTRGQARVYFPPEERPWVAQRLARCCEILWAKNGLGPRSGPVSGLKATTFHPSHLVPDLLQYRKDVGTYGGASGHWVSTRPAAQPLGSARPVNVAKISAHHHHMVSSFALSTAWIHGQAGWLAGWLSPASPSPSFFAAIRATSYHFRLKPQRSWSWEQ